MKNMKIFDQFLIKKLLETHPHLKDNDDSLMANIWWLELKAIGRQDMSVKEFFSMFADNHFTTPESITRARRKIQEQYPELRGAKYNKRQKEQANVKTQLGYK